MLDAREQKYLETEAKIFCTYFSVQHPSIQLIQQYVKGCQQLRLTGSSDEELLLKKIIKHPWTLPFADAAHSFPNKSTLLRKKLLLVFALLETSPEHHKHFRTEDRSVLYWLLMIITGVQAILKWILGKIILIFL